MAEDSAGSVRLAVPGLEVRVDPDLRVASLRYFESAGPFAAAVRASAGTGLPGPLGAAVAHGTAGEGTVILAWRSPTETLVLTLDPARHMRLATELASAPGGCFVDLTGGLRLLRVRGERTAELLSRLGGAASSPRVEESRPCRLADVAALALCVQTGETLLAVDRTCAEHLLGWIRVTLEDWESD
jgi:hypothetical protein